MNDLSRAGLALHYSLRDRAEPGAVLSSGARLWPISAIAIHESAHCVVARYLGLPIAGATIIASSDFAGLAFGPDTDPDKVTSASLREEAERRCRDAMTVLPLPGERRDCTASWVVHSQSLVIECMAGFAAEEIAGFERGLEGASTDYAVAKLYARSIVLSDEAVPSFVESCRFDAIETLKAHWAAVEAVATALDARKTLTGADIDTIIFEAESKALHDAELRRRACMEELAAKAKTWGQP